jgi:predicted TIM-barrel fold metal-dependent hydrolase
MKKIAVEEHYRSKKVPNPPGSIVRSITNEPQVVTHPPTTYRLGSPEVNIRSMDIAELRLRDMDEAGIDMQVLSHTAGLESFDAPTGVMLAKQVNDDVYQAIRRYPKRFAGFATLAPQDPEASALELERAVKELGFVGAKINSNIRGQYLLDNEKYWILFAMAEKLDVPVYIHPNPPAGELRKILDEYLPLNGPIWGYGADAGIAVMRLICSGIFDKHPGLKIILGHLGEALPFWLWRIDNRWDKEEHASNPNVKKLIKKPGQYVKDNIFVTTSGNFDIAPFMCTCSVLGADRILFAVDYPFESNQEAVEFMEITPISDGDKEKVYHLNAEKLLKL